MPCRDWEHIPRITAEGNATTEAQLTMLKSDIGKLQNKNNTLAQLLCTACKLLVENKLRDKMPKALSDWWWAHDKADRKRNK
jgi:hypothetical protein